MSKESILDWLKTKEVANDFLKGATVTDDDGSFKIAVDDKTFDLVESAGTIDDQADAIAAALSGTPTQKMVLKGGRRGKRSARRNRRSSKSSKGGRGNRSRRSRKGCKKSRRGGRTIKGGAKMGKELQAWMKRQKAATGIDPISKKTIAKTKTKSQATGSEQRSDSGKYVEATKRKF
jgi:hypothetical protein